MARKDSENQKKYIRFCDSLVNMRIVKIEF